MKLLSRFCIVAASAALFAPLSCATADSAAPNSTSTAPAAATALDVKTAVGKVAPAWKLAASDNKDYSLSKLRGQWVVLAFYPVDMTAGCTMQARSLTRSIPEFKKRRAQVFGISVQDVDSKKKFCEQEGIKHPLLADVDKSVARSYGVLGESGVANRVTYLIAPDGKVAAVEQSVDVANHGKQVLTMIDKAQAARKAQAAAKKASETKKGKQ